MNCSFCFGCPETAVHLFQHCSAVNNLFLEKPICLKMLKILLKLLMKTLFWKNVVFDLHESNAHKTCVHDYYNGQISYP